MPLETVINDVLNENGLTIKARLIDNDYEHSDEEPANLYQITVTDGQNALGFVNFYVSSLSGKGIRIDELTVVAGYSIDAIEKLLIGLAVQASDDKGADLLEIVIFPNNSNSIIMSGFKPSDIQNNDQWYDKNFAEQQHMYYTSEKFDNNVTFEDFFKDDAMQTIFVFDLNNPKALTTLETSLQSIQIAAATEIETEKYHSKRYDLASFFNAKTDTEEEEKLLFKPQDKKGDSGKDEEDDSQASKKRKTY